MSTSGGRLTVENVGWWSRVSQTPCGEVTPKKEHSLCVTYVTQVVMIRYTTPLSSGSGRPLRVEDTRWLIFSDRVDQPQSCALQLTDLHPGQGGMVVGRAILVNSLGNGSSDKMNSGNSDPVDIQRSDWPAGAL